MTEQIDPRALQAARQAALADPERLGSAYALLLADRSRGLIRSGNWQTSVQLLDLAQAFLRRAADGPVPPGATKEIIGTKQVAAMNALKTSTGLAQLAARTLTRAVQSLPSVDPLEPITKSRLGRNLLQRDLTLARDPAIVEAAVGLCSAAVRETPAPDAEMLANLGNALRARFELTADRVDVERSISNLRRARDATTTADAGRLAVLSDLGDALLAGFAATNNAPYLVDAVSVMRRAVELTPPGHADRPVMLSNMAAGLLRRFERFADPADLADAERCLLEAWQTGGARQDIIRTNLGTVLLKQYEMSGSKAALADAVSHLTAATDIAPADSPERLSALSALGAAHWAAGRLSAARELLSEVALGRETAFSGEHPATLTARHNLATVMALLGHYRTAAEELRVVLAARLRVLGDYHPDTLATRHNLAAALADLGRTAEAETEFETVVRTRTSTLGPDHPDTIESLTALEEIRVR